MRSSGIAPCIVALMLLAGPALAVDTDADGLEDALEAGTTDPLDPDTDEDGLCDGPLDVALVCVGGEDQDADGVVDSFETSPVDADWDDDGLADGHEVTVSGTEPLNADTDSDGLIDGLELGVVDGVPGGTSDGNGTPYAGTGPSFTGDTNSTTTTDPLDADSDDDGLCDGPNVISPCIGAEDFDGDGAVDFFGGETDPENADTDGDGISDGDEVAGGSDPNDPNDPYAIPAVGAVLYGLLAVALAALGRRFAIKTRRPA